jgi:hypothetical protein
MEPAAIVTYALWGKHEGIIPYCRSPCHISLGLRRAPAQNGHARSNALLTLLAQRPVREVGNADGGETVSGQMKPRHNGRGKSCAFYPSIDRPPPFCLFCKRRWGSFVRPAVLSC